MQLGPGRLPGPSFFPRGERNLRLGGVYQIESGSEGGGCRQSPQRNFSFAPLGNPIAPSSVPFGDSFPPRDSLWVVQPYTKKRPKSGYADGHRNRRTTGTMWHNRQNERVATSGPSKRGGGGPPPATLCVRAFSRESLDPPPGTGRGTTSQVLTCDGPNRTTCRPGTACVPSAHRPLLLPVACRNGPPSPMLEPEKPRRFQHVL